MGTILENLHKFHIQNAVDEIHENGVNSNINTDHKLESVYKCRLCGYVYDEAKEGKPFTTLQHCPVCGAVLLTFVQID